MTPRLQQPTDHASEPGPWGWLRRQIAAGYQPGTTWATSLEFVLADGRRTALLESLDDLLAADASVRIGLIAPTHTARCSLAEQEAWVVELLDRMSEVSRIHPHVHLVLFVGMQWLGPDAAQESVRRLRAIARRVADRSGVGFVGLSLAGPGKVRTLNAAIGLAERGHFAGVGWCDDDVRMEAGALQRMVASFLERGCQGAVGATKIPHPKPYVTSKLLYRAKQVAAPATNYPHGCCILVATSVVIGGIPDRYLSDDGYVCFRLLDPDLDDPQRYLHLVPDARCHYLVAGPAGQTRRRIRRLLLNHHVYLADWPIPVSRYYFHRILFPGMWPVAGWDGQRGFCTALQNAAIKWLYFCWFVAVGAELWLRGLVNRPLRRLTWSTYSEVEMPVAPGSEDGS